MAEKECDFPREDYCRYCGINIGWILTPLGAIFSTGCCYRPDCERKYKTEKENEINVLKQGGE